MRGDAGAKTVGAFGLVLFLASCSFQIEQMRLHLDNEKHGSFVFTASTSIPVEVEEGEGVDSNNQQAMQKFEHRLQSCGLGTALYDRGGDYWINARMVFNYPHEATSALGCAPTTWNDMDLQVDKDEGLFWNSYTTKLLFSQGILQPPKRSDDDITVSLNELGNFPRVLRATLPGHIDSIANQSRILGGHVEVEKSGPSSLRVVFTHDNRSESADSKARKRFVEAKRAEFGRGRLQPQDFEKQGSDVLAISVVSYERNYELKDILSVLGVVFGSGFLLQLLGRWLARRTSPPPNSAAEG